MATAASIIRRDARHAADKLARKTAAKKLSRRQLKVLGFVEPPSIPCLTWVRGKSYKQANGGRKGRSGHSPEHLEALAEDCNRTTLAEMKAEG